MQSLFDTRLPAEAKRFNERLESIQELFGINLYEDERIYERFMCSFVGFNITDMMAARDGVDQQGNLLEVKLSRPRETDRKTQGLFRWHHLHRSAEPADVFLLGGYCENYRFWVVPPRVVKDDSEVGVSISYKYYQAKKNNKITKYEVPITQLKSRTQFVASH